MMGRFFRDGSVDVALGLAAALFAFAGGSNRYEGPGRIEQNCRSASAEVVSLGGLAAATAPRPHLNLRT